MTTPGLTLRGVDRNEVVIDGEFQRPNGVSVLFADGVAVENMTAINNTSNGFFWSGVRGYRGSYLTAVNNGVYGIYAFDSGDGLFDHSYASGSPDAGFYIGQCDPCQATITDSISEWNGLGYSGTNASSDLYIVNSIFRHNVAGVAPNTLDGELLPPFHNVTVVGNLVHDNGNVDAPALAFEWSAQGNGILLAGGGDSYVARNRVFNHPQSGIAIFPMLDDNFYMSYDHEIVENVVEGSGLADLTLGGPATSGNCFEDNEFSTSLPAALEIKQPCEGLRLPALFEIGSTSAQLGRLFRNGPPPAAPGRHPVASPSRTTGGRLVRRVNGCRSDRQLMCSPDHSPEIERQLRSGDAAGFGSHPAERNQRHGRACFASTAGVFFGLYAYVLPLVLHPAGAFGPIPLEGPQPGKDDRLHGRDLELIPFLGVVADLHIWHRTIPASHGSSWPCCLAVYLLFPCSCTGHWWRRLNPMTGCLDVSC